MSKACCPCETSDKFTVIQGVALFQGSGQETVEKKLEVDTTRVRFTLSNLAASGSGNNLYFNSQGQAVALPAGSSGLSGFATLVPQQSITLATRDSLYLTSDDGAPYQLIVEQNQP